ncbi:hypothetical protein [Chitinophaga rhizophila]|uniref:Uncharacterized protein n=1 Tax=Chitinophaga rhizophila TaxID=2866212 RepID=A0ABS7GJM1_9BACT|nr:hypothetical protein [Chitinophaga rhizophila]MBW8687907.1 hypothetical protein [Chitinophaga rhizophila]
MGSRVNYTIKSKDGLRIYQDRWAASRVPYDLYLGENAFLEYVKECTITEHLSEHGWMEGFVIADIEKKLLGFWSWELEHETSVLHYFLAALKKKWPGWQLMHLANYMYDAEKLIGIKYTSAQIIPKYTSPTVDVMLNDEIDDGYPHALFIIRQNESIYVIETMTVQLEHVICYGETSINILLEKPSIPLPVEGETRSSYHMVIDVDNKLLIVNNSILGIWETMAHKWPGFNLKMGCIGYLAMLKEANIHTAGLEMSEKKIIGAFTEMITGKH